MAKDERLYARFDIGMDEHKKIMLLSDKAFRALIEGTMYARRQRTDGLLPKAVALKKWGLKIAVELCTNDPLRPSWIENADGYQIHDFDKHQITNADIEVKREAGRLGGLAKASKKLAPAKGDVEQKASTSLAITETETETEKFTTEVVNTNARGSRVPADFVISSRMREWAALNVFGLDIDAKLPEFIDYWKSVAGANGVKRDWEAAWHNGMRKQVLWAARDTPKPSKAQALMDVLAMGARMQAADDRKELE